MLSYRINKLAPSLRRETREAWKEKDMNNELCTIRVRECNGMEKSFPKRQREVSLEEAQLVIP